MLSHPISSSVRSRDNMQTALEADAIWRENLNRMHERLLSGRHGSELAIESEVAIDLRQPNGEAESVAVADEASNASR